jgi:phosphoribosylformylglycinamidine cyclo-ligase
MKHTYAAAGVNFNAASDIKEKIAQYAQSTLRPEVLSGVGFYGGLFELKHYKNPVLVSHTDGVGTKLRIAIALEKFDTVGIDVVNHCVNDILCCGAEPLVFLDYMGMGRLIPEHVADVVKGLAQASREVGCSLIGGETAQMPGIYSGEDIDLVGFVVGVVEKDEIIMGKSIAPGDVILGLPSSGLHTNGFSLARKIFGDTRHDLSVKYPEIGRTIGEALLEPHRSYYNMLKRFLPKIKGLAHITGGGMTDNVPRILPEGTTARFDTKSWEIPSLFRLIQKKGSIDREEMFHVFNMGIGMVVVCSQENAGSLQKSLPEARVIGQIIQQKTPDQWVIFE